MRLGESRFPWAPRQLFTLTRVLPLQIRPRRTCLSLSPSCATTFHRKSNNDSRVARCTVLSRRRRGPTSYTGPSCCSAGRETGHGAGVESRGLGRDCWRASSASSKSRPAWPSSTSRAIQCSVQRSRPRQPDGQPTMKTCTWLSFATRPIGSPESTRVPSSDRRRWPRSPHASLRGEEIARSPVPSWSRPGPWKLVARLGRTGGSVGHDDVHQEGDALGAQRAFVDAGGEATPAQPVGDLVRLAALLLRRPNHASSRHGLDLHRDVDAQLLGQLLRSADGRRFGPVRRDDILRSVTRSHRETVLLGGAHGAEAVDHQRPGAVVVVAVDDAQSTASVVAGPVALAADRLNLNFGVHHVDSPSCGGVGVLSKARRIRYGPQGATGSSKPSWPEPATHRATAPHPCAPSKPHGVPP